MVKERKVGRHKGVREGLAKERKATATPIQKVEPVKRRFRSGSASGAGLLATTDKIAPQRSVNDVVGEDTR